MHADHDRRARAEAFMAQLRRNARARHTDPADRDDYDPNDPQHHGVDPDTAHDRHAEEAAA